MNDQPRLISDQTRWDEVLASLPYRHVLQTWAWGDFKSRWGWRPYRLQWGPPDRPQALAQILHRPLSPTPWGMMYVPKGPVLDYGDTRLLARVLETLQAFARQRRAIFIKIDPDVPRGSGSDSTADSPFAQQVLSMLAGQGWRFSTQQIQFRNTVTLDVSAEEQDILARMKGKWRYNIRLARRRGVIVQQGTATDLDKFYNLYAETSRRHNFQIRPKAYYLDLWSQFLAAGRATLLLAKLDEVPVAGLLLFHFAGTAWYMVGASSERYRDTMPNYLLQWEAIRQARCLGSHRYDMWGAPDVFDPSDSMWGVYRFKIGFGGETWRGLGAHDYPTHRLLYWAYSVALPRLLKLRRRYN